MKKLLLASCLALAALGAWAQERVITGKVSSTDDGSALPGVNVVEKGTGNGAVTDADGKYQINVGSNATLVFSFVGYATKEEGVGSRSVVDISLASDAKSLNEVVVVGYGEVKSKDLTGSVANISNESFNRGVIAAPEQLLQGRTPGVTVTPSKCFWKAHW